MLNVALALVGVGLAFVWVSAGWSGYAKIPGGRKGLLAAGLLVAAGLVAGRVWLGLGRAGLTRTSRRLWHSPRVREAVPVAGLVLVALWVRMWGINFGMPYLEHVDEWNVAERALYTIQTGSFDPHDYRHPGLADNDRQAFTYPTLYTYAETGVFALRYLQGVSAGQFDGTSALASVRGKADFYLWGRALTAILGAGTVLLLYLLGRRVYGRRVGLVGAVFLSFFYLHALNSHWLTTDVPSGFMAFLPFFPIISIAQGRDERRLYLWAGLLAGLAIATKYNNALILAPLVLAHFLGRKPTRWPGWNLPFAVGMAGVGFAAGAPFVFWHLPQFLTDLAAAVNHYQNIGHSGFEGDDNWWQFLNAMLAENAAVVGLALVGLGLLAARHRRLDLVVLSFPLLTYLQLSSYRVNFSRNLMPVIPFLALFAALALVEGIGWLWPRLARRVRPVARFALGPNLAIGLIALLAIVSPTLTILRYDSFNAQLTNRAKATAWVEQNLPHGAKLWLEPFSLDLLPRTNYRLEGGQGVLANSLDWYVANGFHYLVLSESYYAGTMEGGNEADKTRYRSLLEGPLPPGWSVAQDFKKNKNDWPGARITVVKTPLPLLLTGEEARRIGGPTSFDFGGAIRLSGRETPVAAKAGSTLSVVLYWQTLRTPNANYTTFLHLLDAQGQRVAQLDLPPFGGTRPTSNWQPGEVVRDEYPMVLPPGLAPGSYRLVVGLYQTDGPRLPLPDGQTQAILGSIEVR